MPTTEIVTLTAPITVEQLQATEIEHGLIDVHIETERHGVLGANGITVGFILRHSFDDDFAHFVRFVNETACGVELAPAHGLGDRCTRPAGHAGRLHGEATA